MGGAMSFLGYQPQLPPECVINQLIDHSCVVVFAKSTCPYSIKAKEVFKKMDIPFIAIDLDHRPDGGKIQQALTLLTNVHTVPRVFINGKCIGGGDDTVSLYKNGELLKMVRQCMPCAGYCCRCKTAKRY